VEAVFSKSFKSDEDNVYLKRSRDILVNSGVTKFPTVTINSVKVKGSLNVILSSPSPSSSSTTSATPYSLLLRPAPNTSRIRRSR
jgi:hypothetical protein